MILKRTLQPLTRMFCLLSPVWRCHSLKRASYPLFCTGIGSGISQRAISLLSKPTYSQIPSINSSRANFCSPQSVTVSQVDGYKAKGKIQKRCKDCYYVLREGVRYVECKTKPRHKQFEKFPFQKKLKKAF